jgi:hypothetical protein
VAWLQALSATWRAAVALAEKADLLHANCDRIVVGREVSVVAAVVAGSENAAAQRLGLVALDRGAQPGQRAILGWGDDHVAAVWILAPRMPEPERGAEADSQRGAYLGLPSTRSNCPGRHV